MNEKPEKSQEKAKEYSKTKYMLAVSSLAVGLAYLIFMILYGSEPLKAACAGMSSNRYLLIALFTFFFFLIYNVLNAPIDLYNGFLLERKYNLSRQTLGGWAADELKKFAISIALLILAVEAIYLFLRHFPRNWWIFAGIFWFLLTIVIGRIAPEVILPLFYKKTEIKDEKMLERFRGLIPGEVLKIKGIYKISLSKKTRRANAALAGLGSSKQIIIADTLLDNFTPEEIDFVFAHEVSHYIKGHIWKLMLIGFLIALLGFAFAARVLEEGVDWLGYVNEVHDIAAFPLLCLVITCFALLILPLQNFISRLYEKASDAYALVKTRNPDAAISMFIKIARLNLQDQTPNKLIEFLFYDHPSIARRVVMAYKYKKKLEAEKAL